MSKQAVIYARVSTDEQTKGYSLTTQVEACQRFAHERGYTIRDIFSDDYSGASLDRPALNKMREFCAGSEVNAIIVYDVDRLARKSVYQMLIEEEFRRDGILVEYVIGQYDDSDEGRLQKQIRASIAEYEKAKILERSKRGKRGKAQSGYVCVGARPPYGYTVRSEPHKSWLEIDEEEARIVRMVYHWYIYGDGDRKPLSLFGIQSRLTEMGVPTRGDKQEHVAKKRPTGVWSDKMIRNILSNVTYTGIWYYGKTKMISDGKETSRQPKSKRGFGKQVARPREEWIGVEVPAIISSEDFDKAQERLRLNLEQSSRNSRREYLLGRRLRCSACGYTVIGMHRRINNQYYRCNGAWRKPKVCTMPNFRVDQVDAVVWQWIKGLLEDPANTTQGLKDIQGEAIRANQALYDRLDMINARIADSQEQLGKLLDLYLSGSFPSEMLQERKSRLEELIASLERERVDINAHIQKQVITDAEIQEIGDFCAELSNRLDNATFEQHRQIIDLLDVRGTLAIENNEKVVYVRCHIGQQRLSVARTLHLSNIGAIAMRPCACHPTAPSR